MKLLALVALLALGNPSPEELVKLGEGLANRGDGKKALSPLEKALTDTTLSDALRARAEKALGLAYLQLKKPKDAVAHLEKATELNPLDEKGWLLLGLAHDGAEDFDGARAAWKRGTEKLPKSATLRHELGMALIEAGKAGDAATILLEAARLAEQDPEIRTDAAYALTVAGRFKEAKEQAGIAVGLVPESADALYNLGSAEMGLGNTKAARQALTRALEIDEIHVPSLVQLGFLESAANDDKSATKRFLRVLQVEPENARARMGLGASLARLGTDDEKARKLLLDTIHVDPKNVQALALLGEIDERQGKLDDAIKRWEQVKKLRANDAQVKAKLDELKAQKKAAKATK